MVQLFFFLKNVKRKGEGWSGSFGDGGRGSRRFVLVWEELV